MASSLPGPCRRSVRLLSPTGGRERGTANIGRHTAVLFFLLVTANLLAWIWAWQAFASRPALPCLALLAWVFGLRHAVDADHIAAIDNVVRKLMQDGQRPLAVGFFFSLGHSTVVVLASMAIAIATATMQGKLDWFQSVGGTIGTTVSAGFLLMIALVNLAILRGVWREFRHVARCGALTDAGPQAMTFGGGLLAWR